MSKRFKIVLLIYILTIVFGSVLSLLYLGISAITIEIGLFGFALAAIYSAPALIATLLFHWKLRDAGDGKYYQSMLRVLLGLTMIMLMIILARGFDHELITMYFIYIAVSFLSTVILLKPKGFGKYG